MTNQVINPETICQIGFIVRDIEATARRYREIFGLPEPSIVVTPGYEQSKTTYQGKPSEATAKLAFFSVGPLQIELIEPDEKPSVWRDFLETHGEGLHHIAFQVKDTEEVTRQLAAHDIGVAQQGLYSDGSGVYTYMDSAPALAVMIELLQSFKQG